MSPATTVTLFLWPQVRAEHAEWPWIFQPTLWRQLAALVKPDPFLVAAGTSQPISLPFVGFEVWDLCLRAPHRSSSVFSFPCGPRTSQWREKAQVEEACLQEGTGRKRRDHLSAAQKQRNTDVCFLETFLPHQEQQWKPWTCEGMRTPVGSWWPWSWVSCYWLALGILNAGCTFEYSEMLWAYLWGQYLAFQCHSLGFSWSGWEKHGHLTKKEKNKLLQCAVGNYSWSLDQQHQPHVRSW